MHPAPDWLTFLVPAYSGCPRKEAVKQVSVFYVCDLLYCFVMMVFFHSGSPLFDHENHY